jgi:hypothetical protein
MKCAASQHCGRAAGGWLPHVEGVVNGDEVLYDTGRTKKHYQ